MVVSLVDLLVLPADILVVGLCPVGLVLVRLVVCCTLVVRMDVNGALMLTHGLSGVVAVIVVPNGLFVLTWLAILMFALNGLKDGMLVEVDGLDIMLLIVFVVERTVGVVIGMVLDIVGLVGLVMDDWFVVTRCLMMDLLSHGVSVMVDLLKKSYFVVDRLVSDVLVTDGLVVDRLVMDGLVSDVLVSDVLVSDVLVTDGLVVDRLAVNSFTTDGLVMNRLVVIDYLVVSWHMTHGDWLVMSNLMMMFVLMDGNDFVLGLLMAMLLHLAIVLKLMGILVFFSMGRSQVEVIAGMVLRGLGLLVMGRLLFLLVLSVHDVLHPLVMRHLACTFIGMVLHRVKSRLVDSMLV